MENKLFNALEGKTIDKILGNQFDGITIFFEDGSEFNIDPEYFYNIESSTEDARLNMYGEIKTMVKFGGE